MAQPVPVPEPGWNQQAPTTSAAPSSPTDPMEGDARPGGEATTPDGPPRVATPVSTLPAGPDGGSDTGIPIDGRPSRAEDGDAAAPALGLLGVAGTALAVGIGQALRRRRQRLLRSLPPATAPPPPPPEFDELRTELVLTGDDDHLDRLEATLRGLAATLAGMQAKSRPRLVQTPGTGKSVEVFLTEPTLPAASGWRAEASGAVWVSVGKPAAANMDLASPAPLLVTIGEPEDGGQLYLDLEAEGLVSVTGVPGAVNAFARSLLVELSTSGLAEGLAITVVGGADDFGAGELDRVRYVDNWSEVGGDLLAWADQAATSLEANHWDNAFVGRGSSRHDGLAPHLVVCLEPPGGADLQTVAELAASGRSTVSLLTIGHELPGAFRIEVSEDELQMPRLGVACRAQGLGAEAASQVVELLSHAEEGPGQLVLIPELLQSDAVGTPVGPDDLGPYEDPDYDVLVRLLGEIEVVGGLRPLKGKHTAVVAYVALHAPVTSERVEDAVWSTFTESRRKRLANTLSECRTALGAAQIPVVADGRYTVGPRLLTDLDLFDRRLSYAKAQPEVAIGTLRGALELVRGPVFTYRSADSASFVWVDLENWVSIWEIKVTETALRLAQLCSDTGDFDGAAWAAQRGLLVSPAHTGLTEALMRAYHQRGDRLAAGRVYRSHVSALEKLEIDDVAATTVDLYDEIRGRARTA